MPENTVCFSDRIPVLNFQKMGLKLKNISKAPVLLPELHLSIANRPGVTPTESEVPGYDPFNIASERCIRIITEITIIWNNSTHAVFKHELKLP